MTPRVELRKRSGLRLADLAAAAGVSIASVSLWERGLMNLNAQALEKIAHAISTRIDEMFVFENTCEITEWITSNGGSAQEVPCER
jgi:transcriptional regulator with XRE-family HTH domain